MHYLLLTSLRFLEEITWDVLSRHFHYVCLVHPNKESKLKVRDEQETQATGNFLKILMKNPKKKKKKIQKKNKTAMYPFNNKENSEKM